MSNEKSTLPQAEPVVSEVARAIELAGGPAKVGRSLRVSTQTVCFWRDGARQIKSEFGAPLEILTESRVTRKDMWPESWQRIWPEMADPAPTTAQDSKPKHQESANA